MVPTRRARGTCSAFGMSDTNGGGRKEGSMDPEVLHAAPLLSSWAVLVATAGLAGFGMARLRRRRAV